MTDIIENIFCLQILSDVIHEETTEVNTESQDILWFLKPLKDNSAFSIIFLNNDCNIKW